MAQSFRIACALLALTWVPRVGTAQKVSYDFQRTSNFAEVKSFELREGKLSDSPLVNGRITAEIVSALARRGMRMTSDPDVYVVPKLTTEMRKEVTSLGGYGWGWSGGLGPYYNGWYGVFGPYYYGWPAWDWWSPTSYEVRDSRYDTLTIDMIDAKTGALIWRGQGVRHVDPHWKPAKTDRKVHETVTRILRNFPPKSVD